MSHSKRHSDNFWIIYAVELAKVYGNGSRMFIQDQVLKTSQIVVSYCLATALTRPDQAVLNIRILEEFFALIFKTLLFEQVTVHKLVCLPLLPVQKIPCFLMS